MLDGTALVQAIDWIAKEGNDKTSRFYQKVETGRVAADGHVVRRPHVVRRVG
jgi:hypothetical protein